MAGRSREAYFQALGVDVWVRRGSRAQVAPSNIVPTHGTPAAPRPAPAASQRPGLQVDSQPARPRRPPPPPPPSVGEAFRVRCFHYGRVFAAIAGDAWPRRRFLVDVAWALNGFESAERRDLVFDWPQPGATAQGGERAFNAFFGHRTRTHDGIRVILAGARVVQLLGHPVPEVSGFLGDFLYVPPSAPDAAAKKALWRLIADGAPVG